MQVIEKKIGELKPDPNQPRQIIDQEKLKEMAETFKSEGCIAPIEIDTKSQIIIGELRWKAAKMAGLKTIPCIVTERKLDKKDRLIRQLIENSTRADLNIIDKAKAWKEASDIVGVEELKKRLGIKNSSIIRQIISLLKESKETQEKIKKGEIEWTLLEAADRAGEFGTKLKEKVLAQELTSQPEIRKVAKALKDHPEIAKDLLKAETELQRDIIMGRAEMKGFPQKIMERKELTPEQKEEMLYDRMIAELNSITISGLIWNEKRAKELIDSDKIKPKIKNQVRKSIKNIVEKWTKILKVIK